MWPVPPGEPDVTVVVPTKDRPALLEVTLATILGQRGLACEVVVVDDGSVDPRTATHLATAEARGVRVVRHQRSRGACAARNAGAAVARGAWLAFCDDDDVWAPGKLAGQLAAAGDAGWVYAGAVDVDERNRVIDGSLPPSPDRVRRDLDRVNPVPAGASNVVVRRSLFDAAGGFDEGLAHVGDWDLWRRLAVIGEPACVPRPLVGYRQHGGNDNRRVRSILRELRAWERRGDARIAWPEVRLFYGDVLRRAGAPWAAGALYAGAVARRPGLVRDLVRRRRPSSAARAAWVADAAEWLDEVPPVR